MQEIYIYSPHPLISVLNWETASRCETSLDCEYREPISTSYAFQKVKREWFRLHGSETVRFGCTTCHRRAQPKNPYFKWITSITTRNWLSKIVFVITLRKARPRMRLS
jgi:hypothetical protein